jgi:hypothetical protein
VLSGFAALLATLQHASCIKRDRQDIGWSFSDKGFFSFEKRRHQRSSWLAFILLSKEKLGPFFAACAAGPSRAQRGFE